MIARAIRVCSPLALARVARRVRVYAPPKAWEKGELAKPAMQFDADKLDAKTISTSTSARKPPAGGYGVGGGGCGCN